MIQLFFIVVFWIGGMWLVNSMAEARGRETGGWLILAFLLSPLVSIIALAVMGPYSLPDPTDEGPKAR